MQERIFMTDRKQVSIIGAGLAGCEAALLLADAGVRVTLYEQKPCHFSAAHTRTSYAELVCSNSLKADRLDSAGGMLKAEMRALGSHLLPVADTVRVAAGGALAVDREGFSDGVTALIEAHPNITVVHEEIASLPPEDGPLTLIATGPLTSDRLAAALTEVIGEERLYFYDAAAPIVTAESIDRSKVFAASRYGRGEDDYLNCPFHKDDYEAFAAALAGAERAHLHSADDPLTVYEGCMPIEVLAARGADTMRYGPLRPVGLVDPHTGHRPWANVQLRCENAEKTLYNLVGFQTNLKFGEQKRVFSMIPGLENAEFVRYGVMHRNTFLNSPRLLDGALALKTRPNILFAGQITGFEGYMESAACGLLAGWDMLRRLQGLGPLQLPETTMLGSLARYIATENKDFQPMGANMGILPPLEEKPRDKRERYFAVARRGLADLREYLERQGCVSLPSQNFELPEVGMEENG